MPEWEEPQRPANYAGERWAESDPPVDEDFDIRASLSTSTRVEFDEILNTRRGLGEAFERAMNRASEPTAVEDESATQYVDFPIVPPSAVEDAAMDLDSVVTEYNDQDRTFRRYYLNEPSQRPPTLVDRQARHYIDALDQAHGLRRLREANDRIVAEQRQNEANIALRRAEVIRIPTERLEQVDIDQINAIVENRRTIQAFGRLLQELGFGNMSADTPFDETMDRAIGEIRALKRISRDAGEAQRIQVMASLSEHDHHIQWRILNMDDEVLDTSEWMRPNDDDFAQNSMRARLADWQLQGQDVYLSEYHRCQWVNVTTKKEREKRGSISENDF